VIDPLVILINGGQAQQRNALEPHASDILVLEEQTSSPTDHRWSN
jgi:hypothetical protein